jgi:hypothetical protein
VKWRERKRSVLSGVIVGYESRPKYDQRPFPATLQAVREHAMNRVEERARSLSSEYGSMQSSSVVFEYVVSTSPSTSDHDRNRLLA